MCAAALDSCSKPAQMWSGGGASARTSRQTGGPGAIAGASRGPGGVLSLLAGATQETVRPCGFPSTAESGFGVVRVVSFLRGRSQSEVV